MDMSTMRNATAMAPPANIESGKISSMAMSIGDNSCKLSVSLIIRESAKDLAKLLYVNMCKMLLNWYTTDACFLTSTFHIRSSFGFFAACLGAFLLVMSLEFIRRIQRRFDRYLRSRNEYLLRKGQYSVADDIEEELLGKDGGEGSFGTR
ncbi:hypothetical protein B0O99DRAFT_740881 [Bisporella sp. PMI_857]|nr:hypothetical protein B0O99DRAFT_740881 [Bisporella sp. PMI_857]